MKLFQKLAEAFYLPKLRRLEKQIGCKLLFNYIPENYIPAIMSCDMTGTWKRFGLDVEAGLNHFTMGDIENGMSNRFNQDSSTYQSWLGGYSVLLANDSAWTFENHCQLAIADQNSWLRRYGCHHPNTNIKGFVPKEVGAIDAGEFTGKLYEFGMRSQSDVAPKNKTLKLLYGLYGMAALYNLANSKLNLMPDDFMPKVIGQDYEALELYGYLAIFEVKPRVKVVLYANGTSATFSALKEDLLRAIQSCRITA